MSAQLSSVQFSCVALYVPQLTQSFKSDLSKTEVKWDKEIKKKMLLRSCENDEKSTEITLYNRPVPQRELCLWECVSQQLVHSLHSLQPINTARHSTHYSHTFTQTRVRVRVPVYTGSSKHEFACISTAAVHIDTSSVRSVRVTCEFHSYEQFLCRSCFYPTSTKRTTQNL